MTPGRLAFAVAATLLLGAKAARAEQGTGSLEYPVKAAFLQRFGGFVTWPPSAGVGPGNPLVVCVIGRDPFGSALNGVGRSRTGERPIEVRRLAGLDADSGCHVAYLGGGARQSVAAALAATAGRPVLTITDEDVGPTRGAVHFVTSGGRVRFHIDEARAARGGLSISSKLLSLALSVRTGR